MIGGFNLKKKKWTALLGLYLDDILLLLAGICFVVAAAVQFGGVAALTVAGAWMTLCAYVVARANGGVGK
jgi:hypothetical protein